MKKYEVHYYDHGDRLLEYMLYDCLESAITAGIYWLNNSSVKHKLSYVQIFRVDNDIDYTTIAELNK